MKQVLFYLLLVAIVPVSCKKDTVDPITGKGNFIPVLSTNPGLYTIQKGSHYCDQTKIELINKPSITAVVTFNNSAKYTSLTAENQGDVNKLIGFSDCGSDHQENSARLGWSWNGQALVIYAYAYNNKQRITKTLGTAPLNEPFTCSVKAEKGQYYFKLNNTVDSIPRHCSEYTGMHYKLFPYFGGDEVAPHPISLKVEEINP
jgi:hypothetical protein